jgi:hypothetical protein
VGASSSGGATSGATGSGGASGGASGGGPGGPYCPGAEPWPEGLEVCREFSDCAGTSICSRTYPQTVCAACFTPASPCSSDAECGMMICDPVTDPCVCTPGALECQPRCTEGSCDDGTRCGADGRCQAVPCDDGFACGTDERCETGSLEADEHGCVEVSCDEGYACPGGSVCEPESAGAHGCRQLHCSEANATACEVNTDCDAPTPGHGCKPRACSTDAECDCGACVLGTCAPRPGACLILPG